MAQPAAPIAENGGTQLELDTAEINRNPIKGQIDMSTVQRFTSPHTSRFLKFHQRNPVVIHSLAEAAMRYARRKPGCKCGMDLLVGYVRYELDVTTEGDQFKINNNYGAYYARLLMAMYPHLRGLFDLREQGFSETDRSWINQAAHAIGMEVAP